MFPNLQAEQARNKMTDSDVASYLKLCRGSYNQKKRSGRFVVSECNALCDLFDVTFEYLFNMVLDQTI